MKKRASVPIAKDRLRLLLVSDRICCTEDILDRLEKELFQVVSKYADVTKEEFEVRVTHSKIHIKLSGKEQGEKV